MSGSVGDQTRDARVAEELAATSAARVELALRLGREDRVTYAIANGLSLREADRRLRRFAAAGRAPSRVMDDLNR